ncbi:MAG: discoidin domain-containing protein, partial [Methylobacter sp.]
GTVTNIASLASVTASSESIWNNQQAIKAIDGVAAGYPADSTREWATTAQGAGAWIQLNWNAPRTVSKVVLFDRPNTNDQITSATLTFSNGSTVSVGALDNAGGAVTINFAPVVTSNVKVTVTTVSGSTVNVGLSELQVFGF